MSGREEIPCVTVCHRTFPLFHHHRHPRCLALTSSPPICSNYLHRGHHSPISAQLARILTVSQKNPSLALVNFLNNYGKQRQQECSALDKPPIWKMARSPLSHMLRKRDGRFVGRNGRSEERNSSKSQKTLVTLPPALPPFYPTNSLLSP